MSAASFNAERQRWGLGRALWAVAIARVRRWLFLAHVTIRPLRTDPSSESPATLRIATREDLLTACADFPGQLDEAFIEHALTRGDYCLAAFVEDDGRQRMVAFVWRSMLATPHTADVWVEFASNHRYGYKAYTHPDYRGQRLLSANASDLVCRSRGAVAAAGFVETHNYPSITRSVREGNVLVGFAGYLSIGPWILPFRTPGAKKQGFKFIVPKNS